MTAASPMPRCVAKYCVVIATHHVPHSSWSLLMSTSRVIRSVLTRMLVKGGGVAIARSSCTTTL
jgi:hypothetical protein